MSSRATAGCGESSAGKKKTVDLAPGVSLTIPVGTHFQFRCDGFEPLTVLGVTMPPWPGPDEAYAVPGIWEPTV